MTAVIALKTVTISAHIGVTLVQRHRFEMALWPIWIYVWRSSVALTLSHAGPPRCAGSMPQQFSDEENQIRNA
ncbi:hypothetical protein I5N04_01905 [Serratia marcescens]|nr:hypothetical protein [Serratia marcescens]